MPYNEFFLKNPPKIDTMPQVDKKGVFDDDLPQNRIANASDDDLVGVINDIKAQHDAQIPLTQRIFGNENTVKEKGTNALKQISGWLKEQGRGSLVNADGKVYLKDKDGNFKDLDDGILKDLWRGVKYNKGSIALGVAGAAAAPFTGGASLGAVMAGGALGAGAGAAYDYYDNAKDTQQEFDPATMAHLVAENAGLSVLGDGLAYGAVKLGKGVVNKSAEILNKSRDIKDSFGNKIENVSLAQKIKNAVDNAPLMGDVTASNHTPAMGDIKRSIDKSESVLSPDEIAQKRAYEAENKIELDDINTLGIKAKAYTHDYLNRTSSEWLKDKIEKVGKFAEERSQGTLNPQITKEQETALNNAFSDQAELKTIIDVISSNDLVRNKAIDVVDDMTRKRLKEAGLDGNIRLDTQSLKALDEADKEVVSEILGGYVKEQKSEYNTLVNGFKQIAGDTALSLDKNGLDRAIDTIVANYAKIEDRDKMRLTLNQMADEGFNINKAFDVRRFLNKAIRNSDYTGEAQARALKDVLDDSLFKSLNDDGRLKALLKEQDERYAQMKSLKDTKIFNKSDDLLNDDFNFGKIGELVNKNNNIWAKATAGLEKEQVADIEKAYIRSVIKDELIDLGVNKKGLNNINVAQKLKDANFVSDEARNLQKAIFDDEKYRPNTMGIIDAINTGLKNQKLGGGAMATSLGGRATVAFVNQSFKRILKHIPILGKQAGKEHLYTEAFLKAKTGKEAVESIINDPNVALKDKVEFFKQTRSDEVRAVIDDFIKEKEALLKASDETAKPNFEIKESGKPYQYAEQKLNAQQWINDLSGVLNDEWIANLKSLAVKHPEMFKSEADVFRLIKEIKDNPTHFFKNNNERNALIGKELKNGKFGEVGINKESGQIVHTTQINKEKRVKELNKRQERELGNTSLQSDRSARLNRHSDTSQTMATAKAESVADELLMGTPLPTPTTSKADVEGDLLQKPTSEIILQNGSKSGVSLEKSDKISSDYTIGSGLFGGTLNGLEKDENGNITFSPEKFAVGFVGGAGLGRASKAVMKHYAEKVAKENPNLTPKELNELIASKVKDRLKDEALNIGDKLREIDIIKVFFPQKLGVMPENAEKRGIYNVINNGKNSTNIYKDLQMIEDAIKLERGSLKKGGAVHIQKHLEAGSQGEVTQSEVLNIGENMRKYLTKYNEPFIDKNGGKIYEWADENGVRFRVAVYDKGAGVVSARHITTTRPNESIITFYSDRNLKTPMEFKNPKVAYNENLKEWHKNSHEITKNKDGSPKVFYHGSKDDKGFEIFNLSEIDFDRPAAYFSTKKSVAEGYKIYPEDKLYEVYLSIKNPLVIDAKGAKYNSKEFFALLNKAQSELKDNHDGFVFKNIRDGSLNGDGELADTIGVFNENQIKSVKNQGKFNPNSKNIYYGIGGLGVLGLNEGEK